MIHWFVLYEAINYIEIKIEIELYISHVSAW